MEEWHEGPTPYTLRNWVGCCRRYWRPSNTRCRTPFHYPPLQGDPLGRCERRDLGGVWERAGAQQENFTTPSHNIKEPCTLALKKRPQPSIH